MPGFTEEVREVLKRPLTPHTRRGPGGSYTYFKGSDVLNRLNEAFDHGWSSERLEEKVIEDQVLMLVALTVMTKEGDSVCHHGYGSAEIARNKAGKPINIGNTYKSAFTTALKKAAEQFGIGLGEDEEEMPGDAGKPSSGSYNSPTPTSKPPTPMSTKGNAGMGMPMRSPTPMPNRMGNGGSSAPRPPMGSDSGPISLPKAKPAAPVPSADLSNLPVSDTQRKALANLASMKGRREADLINGAGLQKDKFEDLTRDEAIQVIRHANTLPQG